MAEYIDRDKLIREGWSLQRTYQKDATTMVCEMKKPEDFPPADVRPVVRGRWKPFDLTFGRSIYACTSCGEASEVPTEMGTPMYRYCPNCGSYNGGDAE